jgi:hypothetical protein
VVIPLLCKYSIAVSVQQATNAVRKEKKHHRSQLYVEFSLCTSLSQRGGIADRKSVKRKSVNGIRSLTAGQSRSQYQKYEETVEFITL